MCGPRWQNRRPTVADLRCETCRDLAPELALGLLGGDERAAVLAHLQDCERCRDEVAALTVLHERMRLLVPPVEPPAGRCGPALR